jgi:hypothetical protein
MRSFVGYHVVALGYHECDTAILHPIGSGAEPVNRLLLSNADAIDHQIGPVQISVSPPAA